MAHPVLKSHLATECLRGALVQARPPGEMIPFPGEGFGIRRREKELSHPGRGSPTGSCPIRFPESGAILRGPPGESQIGKR